MGNLTKHTAPPTVTAIYDSYVKARGPAHRPHLGGSQIGHHCDRYLWYQFHWCASPSFDGRMLRLFDHGNWEELRLVKDLRAIGATVYEVDPDTGRQIHYSAFGGHFGLSLDGVAKELPEAPHKWHTLEFKTANDRTFKSLKKAGVEADKPQHFAQMQIGMELSGIDRAMYMAVNKNTDEIHAERVRHSEKAAQRLLDRAERVIFSDEPLERVSERPDWYQCKFCDAHDICHQGAVPEVNCRTCLYATAERNGTWTCAHHYKRLSVEEQRRGCSKHLFIPSLISDEQTDAGTDENGDEFVEYGDWRNGAKGPRSYTSREISATEHPLPLPDALDEIRTSELDGELSE